MFCLGWRWGFTKFLPGLPFNGDPPALASRMLGLQDVPPCPAPQHAPPSYLLPLLLFIHTLHRCAFCETQPQSDKFQLLQK
jgi:hypothetical protein